MAKLFGENERRICSLFSPGTSFDFRGHRHTVLFAEKPVCRSGEPKTDIFVRTYLNEGYIQDFKISYKQGNADFIENKTTAERAEQLLGKNWIDIIIDSTERLRYEFESRHLVFARNFRRTEKGAITLGWKFELLRVCSGDLSDRLTLTYRQKYDVYSGTNLSMDKRNATVGEEVIENSGIADFIFEETTFAHNAQDVINRMKTIDEFLCDYPDIYYACKALNYRSVSRRFDGNRPLAVFVWWGVRDNKLFPELIFNRPLITRGNRVCNQLLNSLEFLGVHNVDELLSRNLIDNSFVYR